METYAYYESPLYIIHENEVIYQDAAGRKITHPDLSTFRLLDLNEEIGIAVDKNGIYFKGVFLAVDTCGIEFYILAQLLLVHARNVLVYARKVLLQFYKVSMEL